MLDDGRALHYDLLSFNIGSEVALPPDLAGQPDVLPVKPIVNLWRLREALRLRWHQGRAETRICVIGGGASGCEVVANLHGLAVRDGMPLDLTLITSASRLLPQWSERAARGLAQTLERRGIRLLFERRIERALDHALMTSDGVRYPYDFAVAATGLKPPASLRQFDLPTGPEGGLRVNRALHALDDERIFGAGDCIHFQDRELPKLGVFGVREGPVLQANLLATLEGAPLRTYRPQRRYLSILDLGESTGLALRGRLHWRGHASLRLKQWLDKRFLDRYRADCAR